MRSFSLSTKMSCAVSLLVAAILLLLAFSTQLYFENQLKNTIARQQFNMVSALAEQIDDKIRDAHRQLEAVAKGITPAMLRNTDAAQAFLESRLGSRMVFDGGLFLLDPSGVMYAGTAIEPQMRGKDYSFRDYYRQTVATGKPCISAPLITTQKSGNPTVVFTMPVFDDNGTISAILIGAVDLMRGSFLAKLATYKIAQKGYLYLYDTSRTLIMHPDRSRILKRDVPPGANKLFDRAIEGFEGTDETVTSRGLRAISTFKHLSSTNWILAANYPQAEAYEPIYRARRYFLMAFAAVMAVTILLVWWFMHRLTAPLRSLTRHVQNIAVTDAPHQPIVISSRDEIGALAGAYNEMMAGLESKSRALRQAQKMEAIGTLAGGIAHDFNTILTGIIGYGTILRSEPDLTERQRTEYLAEMLTAADRGVNLTRSLLLYSRGEVIHPEPVELNGIVRGMGDFLTRIAGEGIELELDLAPGELNMLADRSQLEQILMNLASNARDAMAHGGKLAIGTGREVPDLDFIRCNGLSHEGEYALLTVADSGEGMDEATLERVFEPFFSTKGVGRGTGLGLSIVYGSVRQHNGCITVRSGVGEGTTFTLHFPLHGEGRT